MSFGWFTTLDGRPLINTKERIRRNFRELLHEGLEVKGPMYVIIFIT